MIKKKMIRRQIIHEHRSLIMWFLRNKFEFR